MKLEEFDFDIPQAEKLRRLAFRAESRCVTSLYEKCFLGLTVKRGWKVLLECVPVVTLQEIRDLLGVLTLQVQFDPDSLQGQSKLEKKQSLLAVLQSGVTTVAAAEGWPTEPFQHAHREVLERDIRNEWVWKKPKWGPGRKLRAHLWCSHDMDAFRAWLVVQDRDGVELARRLSVETDPSEFSFVPMLGEIRWTSRRRVMLLTKDKEEASTVEVP